MWKTKFRRCIYTSPSGYKVYQNLIYRWLTLGSNALQTVLNRIWPQRPVLHYIPVLSLMVRKFPGDCCLLGLGGGGIPHLLARSSYQMTAIESSDEVIHIAREFFMTDRIHNLNIIHDNALNYLQTNSVQYPHIIVDLYDANHFPSECSSDAFFIACKNRLAPDGFIGFNLANLKEHKPIFNLIKKQFPTTVVIPVKKCANIIILASSIESKDLFVERLMQTKEVSKVAWVESWGFVGVHRYKT